MTKAISAGKLDSKAVELCYIRECLRPSAVEARLVGVSMSGVAAVMAAYHDITIGA